MSLTYDHISHALSLLKQQDILHTQTTKAIWIHPETLADALEAARELFSAETIALIPLLRDASKEPELQNLLPIFLQWRDKKLVHPYFSLPIWPTRLMDKGMSIMGNVPNHKNKSLKYE